MITMRFVLIQSWMICMGWGGESTKYDNRPAPNKRYGGGDDVAMNQPLAHRSSTPLSSTSIGPKIAQNRETSFLTPGSMCNGISAAGGWE
jgi:hypothetical protein